MSEGRFVPLSKRGTDDEVTFQATLHEGVPEHLWSSVVEFLRRALQNETDYRMIELKLEINVEYRYAQGGRQFWRDGTFNDFMDRFGHDDTFVLDLVDERLRTISCTATTSNTNAESLRAASTLGGSAWMVGETGQTYCLEPRVEPTVRDAYEQAASHGRSGTHLQMAWSAAYSRDPAPSIAYEQAIKAVEAVATPIVTPMDVEPTLGKIVTMLRDSPQKFRVALTGKNDAADPVNIVRLMGQLLWSHDHARHGSPDKAKPISVGHAEAVAAVHLAVLLVQWFETGVVTRA